MQFSSCWFLVSCIIHHFSWPILTLSRKLLNRLLLLTSIAYFYFGAIIILYYIFSFIIEEIALFFFCRCRWSFEQSFVCVCFLRYICVSFECSSINLALQLFDCTGTSTYIIVVYILFFGLFLPSWLLA